MSDSSHKYSEYLKTRRWSGLIYRYIFIYPFFLQYLGLKNVDYGCGIGDFLNFAKFFKKHALGLDINPHNIQICRQQGHVAELLKSNQQYFTDKKNSINCIVLDNVLEHISDPHFVMSDICHGLITGGYLIIGIPVGQAGYKADPDHKMYYDEDALKSLLEEYSLIKTRAFYRPLHIKYFRNRLKQFCYYAVFQKAGA